MICRLTYPALYVYVVAVPPPARSSSLGLGGGGRGAALSATDGALYTLHVPPRDADIDINRYRHQHDNMKAMSRVEGLY